MTISLLGIFDGWALLVMRLAVAAIFIIQGWAKVRHLKEVGEGFELRLKNRVGAYLGPIVAFMEFLGGLAILIGFFTQIVALGLASVIFLKIIFRVMQRAGGVVPMEFEFLILATLIGLAVLGGGFFALDPLLPRAAF